jgi:Tol biopolymer transport system component
MARSHYLRALTIAAGALAALLVLTALGNTPAEAKKRNSATNIVFASKRSTDFSKDPVSTDLEIFSIKPDGTGLKQLTFNNVDDRQPTLSADGSQIAFTRVLPDGGDGNQDIWLMLPDGSSQFNFTGWTSSDESTPVFSRDRTRIAFTYQCDTLACHPTAPTSEEIAVIEVDGSAHLLTNTPHSAYEFRPDFSPDGTKIAFTKLESPGATPGIEYQTEIYVMDSDPFTNDTPTNLTNNAFAGCWSMGTCINDFRPRWSPNGSKIIYDSAGFESASNPDGDFDVFVMNAADGSGKRNLTEKAKDDDGNPTDEIAPDYKPSGKQIVYNKLPTGNYTSTPYQSPNNTPGELFRMATDGSKTRPVTKTGNTVVNQSPDWGRAP